MISRAHNTVFIHIPKAAGSSVEKVFNVLPFDWKEMNINHLVGWDPTNGIHLQHASVTQLINAGYISEDDFKHLYSFTIVRNPFDRAVSDYFYLSKRWGINDSFENYILENGDFLKIFDRKRECFGEEITPNLKLILLPTRKIFL